MTAAQGRDGRKDHQRRTGNDPQGPTGRAAGTYTPSAAQDHPTQRNIWESRCPVLLAERDRYREALEAIESMTGAAGAGQIPAMPIAARARKALA